MLFTPELSCIFFTSSSMAALMYPLFSEDPQGARACSDLGPKYTVGVTKSDPQQG